MVNMTISFTKLDFSFLVHSTEDFDKNMVAIANLIPEEMIKNTKIIVEELEGGYNNPIQYVFIEFKKSEEIEKILENLVSQITQEQKNQLNTEFENRFDFDGKTFFLRIDKEGIFKNKLDIATSDNVIKIAIKTVSYVKNVDFKGFLKEKGIL